MEADKNLGVTDFHDYEWKLGRFKERLKKESFSKQDQTLILDFIEERHIEREHQFVGWCTV